MFQANLALEKPDLLKTFSKKKINVCIYADIGKSISKRRKKVILNIFFNILFVNAFIIQKQMLKHKLNII